MKPIVILFFITYFLNAQSLFEGRAGDVWHITGSCIGTLALQKGLNIEWYNAALIMFSMGVALEILDDVTGNDPYNGFSENDIFFDVFGVLMSYPLRYETKSCSFSFTWRFR